MSKHYADFCLYCTGNNRKDIKECDDTNCPFYPFRFGGLSKEMEKEAYKDVMRKAGMIE